MQSVSYLHAASKERRAEVEPVGIEAADVEERHLKNLIKSSGRT
jgi:hypothetical protein